MEKILPPTEPGQTVELPYIEMHGPVEVEVKLSVMIPDPKTKMMRGGRLVFQMEAGQIPTRARIQQTADAMFDPSDLPPGTRLMTKPEFVEYITKRDTGAAVPMPGLQEFVRAPAEIPHAMLVHAVAGVTLPENSARAEKYLKARLVRQDWRNCGHGENRCFYPWDQAQLTKLGEAELLALYQQITQP